MLREMGQERGEGEAFTEVIEKTTGEVTKWCGGDS
jgi:hypothetical protein